MKCIFLGLPVNMCSWLGINKHAADKSQSQRLRTILSNILMSSCFSQLYLTTDKKIKTNATVNLEIKNNFDSYKVKICSFLTNETNFN